MKTIGNVLILGDSYSTFKGAIPEGYSVYYSAESKETHDISGTKDTWWGDLIQKARGNLIQNNSYSGSTICYTGYDGADFFNISFITRFKRLVSEGFFENNKIHTLFIFGGTNDNWSNAPLGKIDLNNIPEDFTKEELYNVLPAFCCLLRTVKNTLPDTRIVCIINTELKQQIVDNYKALCDIFGVDYIELHDIEKVGGHPNRNGMMQISDQLYDFL